MTAEFDEAWLRAYQARTGCGAREYGGSLPQSPCGDGSLIRGSRGNDGGSLLPSKPSVLPPSSSEEGKRRLHLTSNAPKSRLCRDSAAPPWNPQDSGGLVAGCKQHATAEELSAKPTEGEKSRPKYGNRKTRLDGITFDSKHESEVYAELKMRQRAGDIAAMAMQVRFRLGERIEYIADFVVIDAAGAHVIDAKSDATRRDKVYRIKKKLMREKWGIEIEEV